MPSFALGSSGYSAFPSIFLRRLSWARSWRALWLIGGTIFALRAIIGDQIYLEASKHPNPHTYEMASKAFPYERAILLGRAYYFLRLNAATPEGIREVREGIKKDPTAADLIVADMVYSYTLGKNDDAIRAFAKLEQISPKSWYVQDVKQRQADDLY